MATGNDEIARLFSRYATLLELENASPFRVRAYRNAARMLEGLPGAVADRLRAGRDLTELPGIGADLAAKMAEIVHTGRLADLEALQQRTPPVLLELSALPGLGPKRVKLLYEELGVDSLEDLKKAGEAGAIRQVRGFGAATERRILDALAKRRPTESRIGWLEAEQIAQPLIRALRAAPRVKTAVVAGSFRRRRETVGDLDILVTVSGRSDVMSRFTGYEDVDEVVSQGSTRSTVRLRSGLQVDLRVVPESSYGAALQYFTGSKAHNIALRGLAAKRGLKLSEYGLFAGRRRVAGRSEAQIYKRLGLRYVEPELREDSGEIEAAAADRLPALVDVEDLRGDLHCHTRSSDGTDTLEAMAAAAEQLGYEYLSVSDHTRHLAVAHGLDARALRRQMAAIDRLNGRRRSLTLLKSAEVDILADGSLDLGNDILRELDVVIVAVHSGLDLSSERQTERIVRAMDNPYCNIVAHPTGRLLGERDAYAVDMEHLVKAAAERGCYLEVNAQPARLDLADSDCRLAKQLGAKLCISTDAHSAAQLRNIRLGVAEARRGWLEPKDVLNTRTLTQLRKLLKRR
jgi:DNA polymerase (family X)